MSEFKMTGEARLALEKGIHLYFESRRKKVDAFVANHFEWKESLDLQRKYLLVDLIRYPANALWAIPYLGFKKAIESIDKMGWKKWVPDLKKVPSGFRTNYQREIEKFILQELLEVQIASGSQFALQVTQQLPEKLRGQIEIEKTLKFQKYLNEELEKYSSSRGLISDLAGTFSTMFIGWFSFGDHSMSLTTIGNKIASKMAREKASSNFFLGKKLGGTFYTLFPPSPTKSQIVIATVVVGLLLTIISLVSATLSDPLRKKLGMQQANLHEFLNQLEDRLLLELSRQSKVQTQLEATSESA